MAKPTTTKIPGALLDELTAASIDDPKWLAENYSALVRRYPDQFVAVFNKKVVGSHRDISELMRLVDRRLPRVSKLVSTEYLTSKKATVIL
ncbi:hypothetical protein E3J38_07750 [candidate division TA06 bacterium]|uniref:DUF5678 domain-containing protein n=1 Tax=candidate division TA06 bacterium TaxID=2250710 RepID=A0A523XIJ8_UNCT6|nr:MAG: hypothetical protein E3J38_07750 [candidate division TA06 bacterium]